MGGAFQNLNRLEEAEDCFHEAAQGFEKVGEQVSEPGKYGEYQTTLSKLYAHYANLKLARKRYVDLELTHKHDMEVPVMVERGGRVVLRGRQLRTRVRWKAACAQMS